MRNETVHAAEQMNEVDGFVDSNVSARQLIEELGTVRGAFEWRVTEQQRIRGLLKNDAEFRWFDPITAIAFSRTGKYFPEGHANEAARSIGMSFVDCADVVAACNYDWHPACRQGSLRSDLMTALLEIEPAGARKTASDNDRSATTH